MCAIFKCTVFVAVCEKNVRNDSLRAKSQFEIRKTGIHAVRLEEYVQLVNSC